MDVGLKSWVLLEDGSKFSASEFCRSLATMAVKDCEAAIEATALEVVKYHVLRTPHAN